MFIKCAWPWTPHGTTYCIDIVFSGKSFRGGCCSAYSCEYCRMLDKFHRFGRMCPFHLQGDWIWLRWKLTIIHGVLVNIGFYIVFVEGWSVKTALTIVTIQDLGFLRDLLCAACINCEVDCVWIVMAHVQKPHFVFWWNGWVRRRGRQFSRLQADEVCASAVVMLDTPLSEEVWRVLATHSICQFPLHFPSCVSPCAITFQLDFTS